MVKTDPLADLNAAQAEAVGAGPGPMLVIAGAGTGKTRVIARRVAWTIAHGESPGRILLLTFTQRAARQMIGRIAEHLDRPTANAVWAGTFHAICARLIRQHGARLGLRTDFGLLDPSTAAEVLGDVLDGVSANLRGALPPTRTLLRIFSWSLNTDRPLTDALTHFAPRHRELADALDALCAEYTARKIDLNLLDFDDLLVFAHLLLTEHHDLRDAIALHLRHVLVDEYQDTNPVQAALVAMLAGHHRNLCAVGDDAQAIYGFRGADVGHILGFTAAWPDARVVRLEENYRSTPEILTVANRALEPMKRRLDKTLTTSIASGPKPALVRLDDDLLEARFIAARAMELRDEGTPLRAQAVLYRAHAHARRLQLELTRQGVRFTVRSGKRLVDQAHVRDVLAWLRVCCNPADVPAWRRILRLTPGVGKAGAERILAGLFYAGDPWAALADDLIGPALPVAVRRGFEQTRRTLLALAESGGRPGPMMGRVLADGYLDHLRRAFPDDHAQREADLRALAGHADRYPDPASFLEELALVDDLTGAEMPDALVLSTIHQAKGLEWDAVYVLGLSEGRFPARLDGDLDEERRLFYVALTRARRWLHLCSPARERDGGLPRQISRFVADLPHTDPTLVETWRIADS